MTGSKEILTNSHRNFSSNTLPPGLLSDASLNLWLRELSVYCALPETLFPFPPPAQGVLKTHPATRPSFAMTTPRDTACYCMTPREQSAVHPVGLPQTCLCTIGFPPSSGKAEGSLPRAHLTIHYLLHKRH